MVLIICKLKKSVIAQSSSEDASLKYAKRQQFTGLGFHIFQVCTACCPMAAFGLVKILLGVGRALLGNLFIKSKVQVNPLKKKIRNVLYISSSTYKRRPAFLTVL